MLRVFKTVEAEDDTGGYADVLASFQGNGDLRIEQEDECVIVPEVLAVSFIEALNELIEGAA